MGHCLMRDINDGCSIGGISDSFLIGLTMSASSAAAAVMALMDPPADVGGGAREVIVCYRGRVSRPGNGPPPGSRLRQPAPAGYWVLVRR